MKRLKRLSSLFFALALALLMAVPVFASAAPSVADDAGLFTDDEWAGLSARAAEVSGALGIDVGIHTSDHDHGRQPKRYAADYYVDNGYGLGADYDGVLFYIDLYNRELVVITDGIGRVYFDDEGIEYLLDAAYGPAGNGDWYRTAMAFLDEAEVLGLQAKAYAESTWLSRALAKINVGYILTCILVGAAAAAAVVGIMLAVHNAGKPKPVPATSYYGEEGVRVTHTADIFLTSNITRRALPKDSPNGSGSSGGGRSSYTGGGRSSSVSSSSGRSVGGGSCKF